MDFVVLRSYRRSGDEITSDATAPHGLRQTLIAYWLMFILYQCKFKLISFQRKIERLRRRYDLRDEFVGQCFAYQMSLRNFRLVLSRASGEARWCTLTIDRCGTLLESLLVTAIRLYMFDFVIVLLAVLEQTTGGPRYIFANNIATELLLSLMSIKTCPKMPAQPIAACGVNIFRHINATDRQEFHRCLWSTEFILQLDHHDVDLRAYNLSFVLQFLVRRLASHIDGCLHYQPFLRAWQAGRYRYANFLLSKTDTRMIEHMFRDHPTLILCYPYNYNQEMCSALMRILHDIGRDRHYIILGTKPSTYRGRLSVDPRVTFTPASLRRLSSVVVRKICSDRYIRDHVPSSLWGYFNYSCLCNG